MCVEIRGKLGGTYSFFLPSHGCQGSTQVAGILLKGPFTHWLTLLAIFINFFSFIETTYNVDYLKLLCNQRWLWTPDVLASTSLAPGLQMCATILCFYMYSCKATLASCYGFSLGVFPLATLTGNSVNRHVVHSILPDQGSSAWLQVPGNTCGISTKSYLCSPFFNQVWKPLNSCLSF